MSVAFSYCCGKIGFLPKGHEHVRAKVSGVNLCRNIHYWCNLFLSQTCFWRLTKSMNLFAKVCHGRFHDILPKEYSGAFLELLWGKIICYKMWCLLTIRVSQILSLTRLIPLRQTYFYCTVLLDVIMLNVVMLSVIAPNLILGRKCLQEFYTLTYHANVNGT